MRRRLLVLGGVTLLVGAAALAADAPPSAAPAAPRIVVEPASFDFGTVRPSHVVQKEFLIRNHGRAELVIASVDSSCGCAAALTDTMNVMPGGSTPLRVKLTAPAEAGRLRKSVLIKSNDPERPAFEVKIEAVVAGTPPARH